MKLIPEIKESWKFSSLWLQGAATTFFTWLLLFPDAALYVWSMMPEDVKGTMDPKYVALIGTALGVLAMFARVVHQK
ncbi:MAG TPA: hypothetical protein VNQ97_06775, partial [Burkholderiaceae bacterium]|nr:hypothetical protein [Burkholderiaceae bacterium]